MDDLNSMNIEELHELRKKLDRAISNYETRTRQAALDAAEKAARGHGYKLADLVSGQKNVRKKPDVRYVNPNNQDETWSGRGRRPAWFKAAIEAGRSLDELSA